MSGPALATNTVDVVRLVRTSTKGGADERSSLWSTASRWEAGTKLVPEAGLTLRGLVVLAQLAHNAIEGAQTILAIGEALLGAGDAVVGLLRGLLHLSYVAPELCQLDVGVAIEACGRCKSCSRQDKFLAAASAALSTSTLICIELMA